MRVSVLVSTCNRCDKLRLLLDALKAKGPNWPPETEVLVIDNNSSDATKQVVAEYTSSEDPVFRYLLESKPGKSRALNAGVREARGEIIAFTDDDCIPSPSWVASILKEFESDSELSILGGRVELYDQRDVPQAILLSNCRTLVTNAREVCETPAIIGANMAFRKTVLQITRGFDPLLGPGSMCKAFEDLDLIYRSLKKKATRQARAAGRLVRDPEGRQRRRRFAPLRRKPARLPAERLAAGGPAQRHAAKPHARPLAETLARLAEAGPGRFLRRRDRRGDRRRRPADGGVLAAEDLAQCRARIVPSLDIPYRGYTLPGGARAHRRADPRRRARPARGQELRQASRPELLRGRGRGAAAGLRRAPRGSR